jgi:hypothetical protein
MTPVEKWRAGSHKGFPNVTTVLDLWAAGRRYRNAFVETDVGWTWLT